MRTWYRVQNEASTPTVADIYITDFIGDWLDDYFGFGVTAKSFLEALGNLPAAVTTIRVHINSPGGDVFSATTIANALRDQQLVNKRSVETVIDGLAASAASVIAMAGRTVTMADNALMMIHQPWTGLYGNAAELRKVADELDTITKAIVATYQWHSTLSADEIVALMDATTWMDADEAIARGFATEKVEGLKAAASLDPKALVKLSVPDQYRARVEALTQKPQPAPAPTPAPVAATAEEIFDMCEAAGCVELAKTFRGTNATVDEVTARVAEAQAAKAAASQRATEIRALCKAAKQDGRAELYIRSALSLDDVRLDLATITAQLDKVEIDTGLKPDHQPTQGRVIDRVSIYDRFNRRQTIAR